MLNDIVLDGVHACQFFVKYTSDEINISFSDEPFISLTYILFAMFGIYILMATL